MMLLRRMGEVRREVMEVCRVDLRGRQCVFRLFNPKINDQTTQFGIAAARTAIDQDEGL